MHFNFYKKRRTLKKIIIAFSFLLLPLSVSAYELNLKYPYLGINLHYTQMLGISGLVTWLYYMVIAIATAAAFGVIVWGGFEYLTSAGDSGKMRSGVDRIQNAVIGLLIVIVSYLGLNTINPNILSLDDPFLPELPVGGPVSIIDWPSSPFEESLNESPSPPGERPSYPGGSPADWISPNQIIPCGWPVQGNITSSYGYRCTYWRSGCGQYRNNNVACQQSSNCWNLHAGIDFGAPCGTPVYASAEGTVVFRGISGSLTSGYGYMIDVRHANGYTTRYAHLSSFAVSQGQSVYGGQNIGHVGTTGSSTGCHLHYEVRLNNNHRDPAPYLPSCL